MERTIIDVREPFEFDMGHVKGAINIPLSELADEIKALRDIPKGAEIVLYCRTGSRASVAARMLARMNYTNLVNGINQECVEAMYGA